MKRNRKTGFTLIELIVMIGILGVIVIAGSGLFLTLLRSSVKTRALVEVKQSGSYAMEVMSRMIRNAQTLVAYEQAGETKVCETNMTKLVIKNPDDGETEFICWLGDPTGGEDNMIASNSSSLTSRRVKLDACRFDCYPGQEGLNPDRVEINFTLSQLGEASRPEEKTDLDFSTEISLRNF